MYQNLEAIHAKCSYQLFYVPFTYKSPMCWGRNLNFSLHGYYLVFLFQNLAWFVPNMDQVLPNLFLLLSICFQPGSYHYDFRDWLSLTLKSWYVLNNVSKIINVNPQNNPIQLCLLLCSFSSWRCLIQNHVFQNHISTVPSLHSAVSVSYLVCTWFYPTDIQYPFDLFTVEVRQPDVPN